MEDIIDIIVTETTNTIEITSQSTDEVIDVNIIDNREDIVLNVTPTVVEININSLTGNFGVEWGDITGTLADQTDLNTALGLKANLVGGKVPASELPSYVDDVVEVANFAALPATGETGKIYITLDNNKIYRWSGSVYVEIADSAAVWGAITGTLSSQTDLQSALDAKLSVTTAASTYVPYTGATGDVNLGLNVLKSNNVILDGDTSATGYLGFKQFSGAQGGGLGYSSISATGLTKFYFRAYQTGTDVKSFNFDLASLTNLTERNYTLPDASGTLALTSNLSTYVPYTGATGNVDLGTNTLLAAKGTFSSSGSSDTVGITHSSGSGIALNISKAGNGEGIYVNKSSGSGNAVTIVGTLNATTLVKNGGTSSQFLKADGSVDSSTYVDTSSNQSIAGIKTFTTSVHAAGLRFSESGGFANVSGYTQIGGTADYFNFVNGVNSKQATFNYGTGGSGYTYTLPNSNGTLALTSQLSSYLPLSGGTLTGALTVSVNGSTFGTASASGRGLIIQSGSSDAAIQFKNASGGDGTLFATGTSTTMNYSFSTYSTSNALFIANAGNVGIGTTSPGDKLTIVGTGSYTGISVDTGSTTGGAYIAVKQNGVSSGFFGGSGAVLGDTSTDLALYAEGSKGIRLYTNGTNERMRITSGGDVLVGKTTTATNESGVQVYKTANTSGRVNIVKTVSGTNSSVANYHNGTYVGGMDYGDTLTTFLTTSDYRLKEDLQTIKGLEIIKKIKVYDYKWKSEDSRMNGVLAHELAEILPYAVSGVKDGERMQGVDYSKIVPVMIQAIKELKAELDTLKNK